jgi:hypothetical protein
MARAILALAALASIGATALASTSASALSSFQSKLIQSHGSAVTGPTNLQSKLIQSHGSAVTGPTNFQSKLVLSHRDALSAFQPGNPQPGDFHHPFHGSYVGGGYAYGGYRPVQAYYPATPVQTYASTPVQSTPSRTYCLTKIYQTDGSALFTDTCTGEQAATAPTQPAYPQTGG